MIAPRWIAAVILAVGLALLMAPARSAETATANDTARFLAGLPPGADSPLAALAKSATWEQHARRFDYTFGLEDKNTLSKIRAFSQQRLPEKHQTMLYMFSGPDFLYAASFFPTATTYVLAGLEPVGAVPQLTALSRASIDVTLYNLEASLASLLSVSFFITHNMRTQLEVGPVYGTLPILYVFLARTGKTIHDVSLVSLDADGNVQTASAAGDRNSARGATGAKGVKIVFSDGEGPQQTLYYFSTNLADDGVRRSGFLQFCDKLGDADSFLKSASYLMFGGGFDRVRNFLVNRSATIVQDDSGIPFAYFDPKKWRLQPFGRYLGPISEFPSRYQPRMAELYRTGGAVPIDFGLGYRWRRNESNLLVAQRIGPADEEALNAVLTIPPDTPAVSKPRHKRSDTDAKGSQTRSFLDFPGLFGLRSSK